MQSSIEKKLNNQRRPLSTRELSEATGLYEATVRQLCRMGIIHSYKTNGKESGNTFIPVDAAEGFTDWMNQRRAETAKLRAEEGDERPLADK